MAKASQLIKAAGLSAGMFTCERCTRYLPDDLLKIEDGRWLCTDRCSSLWTKTEDEIKLAAAQALTDPMTPNQRPPQAPCALAPTITSLSPRPIQLAIGGGASVLSVGGVNLSASDTWDYGHAGITGVVTVTSTEAVSISLSASGAVPAADYAITYNGQKFRKAIRTR